MPQSFRALKAAFLAALLSACSPLGAVNLLVPNRGYTVRAGLAYGPDPRQKLDVYIPDGLKGPAPVLLFFYGGSWKSGNRADYKGFGQAFASKGFVTVVADYRLYPQVKFEGFVADGARALAFVHAHAADYGGDAGRLFVSGHSAGGYNAVMLASDPQYLKAAGADLSMIKGVIGIAGPYDFLPLTDPDYIAMFHGASNAGSMPINHIDGPRPPMLLIAGDADSVVRPGNADRMAAKLKSTGNSAAAVHYAGVGHIGIILSLLPGFRGNTPLREDITTFIQSH
jgi:acetyl esterase/lipase